MLEAASTFTNIPTVEYLGQRMIVNKDRVNRLSMCFNGWDRIYVSGYSSQGFKASRDFEV